MVVDRANSVRVCEISRRSSLFGMVASMHYLLGFQSVQTLNILPT